MSGIMDHNDFSGLVGEEVISATLEFRHLDATYVLYLKFEGGYGATITLDHKYAMGKIPPPTFHDKTQQASYLEGLSRRPYEPVGGENSYLLLGGPSNGRLIHTMGSAYKVPVVSDLSPVFSPGAMEVTQKVETTLYTMESVALNLENWSGKKFWVMPKWLMKALPTHYTRVMRHESVPHEAIMPMLSNNLIEFPVLRFHPGYAPFWLYMITTGAMI